MFNEQLAISNEEAEKSGIEHCELNIASGMGVSETSRRAFEDVKDSGLSTGQRERIYRVLEFANMPLTSLDIQGLTEIRLSSITARIHSLRESGCVAKSGKKLDAASGKQNDTYVVSAPYTEALKKVSEKQIMRQRIAFLEERVKRLELELNKQPRSASGQGLLFEG